MLAAFRSFAKSPWAIGLLGLIIVAFVLVGTTDIFGTRVGVNVITAGTRTVTQNEFSAAFKRSLQQLGQQYGQPVSQEMALEQGLDQRILGEMTRSEALAELLNRIGLRAPQDSMREQLREIPAFFDPLTGEFSETNYADALRREGLTREMFEKDMRDGLTRAQFIPAAADGLQGPLAYSALGGVIALEQRDLAYLVVTPQSVGKISEPTDAEIQAFMKENAAQLTLPEFRGMTIVRLSRKAMEGSVTVNPAEVQKRSTSRKTPCRSQNGGPSCRSRSRTTTRPPLSWRASRRAKTPVSWPESWASSRSSSPTSHARPSSTPSSAPRRSGCRRAAPILSRAASDWP